DYIPTVQETMGVLAAGDSAGTRAFAPFAAQIRENGWVKANRRIFDNKKVSDHFAIIPTLQAPRELSDAEGKLYDLVVRRFLAVFYPAAEYRLTTRITQVAGHRFKTEGKVLVAPGWLAVYGRAAQGEEATLTAVAEGEVVKTEEVEAVG